MGIRGEQHIQGSYPQLVISYQDMYFEVTSVGDIQKVSGLH